MISYNYAMQYDVIYHPFPVNSQHLKMWGLTALPTIQMSVNFPPCGAISLLTFNV